MEAILYLLSLLHCLIVYELTRHKVSIRLYWSLWATSACLINASKVQKHIFSQSSFFTLQVIIYFINTEEINSFNNFKKEWNFNIKHTKWSSQKFLTNLILKMLVKMLEIKSTIILEDLKSSIKKKIKNSKVFSILYRRHNDQIRQLKCTSNLWLSKKKS